VLNITGVDWVMLAILLASLVIGAWRGLVYEVLSLMGWVAAFVLAQWLAQDVGAMLPMSGASERLRYPAGFVLVFIGVLFASGLLAWLVKKLIKASGLRPIDRALGAVFGVLRGVLVLLALCAVVNMTAFKDDAAWRQSGGAAVLTTALKGLKPVLPEQFGRYLPA
jgi:membrane protein required for colicin V production